MDLLHGGVALLVIDMQHDFVDEDGAVPCVGARRIIPVIRELVQAARQADVPVIYTQEVHRATRIDFGRELDGAETTHCLLGTRGVEIVPELAPQPGDVLIRKPRYSAFLGTDLPFVLSGLGIHPGDTLIVTGVATDVCVHYTCADAHQYDYRVRVVRDAVAGTSLEAHHAALRAIDYLQRGSLIEAHQLVAALATRHAQLRAAAAEPRPIWRSHAGRVAGNAARQEEL